MPFGKGKYDDLCTHVREQANAEGAAVIVINGDLGVGFSVQGPLHVQVRLPDMLEFMAREIRKSLARSAKEGGPEMR